MQVKEQRHLINIVDQMPLWTHSLVSVLVEDERKTRYCASLCLSNYKLRSAQYVNPLCIRLAAYGEAYCPVYELQEELHWLKRSLFVMPALVSFVDPLIRS